MNTRQGRRAPTSPLRVAHAQSNTRSPTTYTPGRFPLTNEARLVGGGKHKEDYSSGSAGLRSRLAIPAWRPSRSPRCLSVRDLAQWSAFYGGGRGAALREEDFSPGRDAGGVS
jgi:hypothetical protein